MSGRKSKYLTHVQPYLEMISLWVNKGASQEEVAQKLQVAPSTLKLYLKKGLEGIAPFSDFSDCYTRARTEPDDKVKAALFSLACGGKETVNKNYKVKEITFDPTTGKKVSEIEKIVQFPEEVLIAPNVEAQKFWLANRCKDMWSYRPEPADTNEEEDESYGVVLMPEVMEAPSRE